MQSEEKITKALDIIKASGLINKTITVEEAYEGFKEYELFELAEDFANFVNMIYEIREILEEK